MSDRNDGMTNGTPQCLVVQHVAPELPYALADALTDAGVGIDVRRVYAGEPLPTDVSDFAGVVVMGGPMAAHRNEGFPTRQAELGLLANAITRRVPTIGVCLGAQLLALAGGGKVFPGTSGLEVGWAPVEITEHAADDPLLAGMPDQLTVLHWHGDTYEPPAGAVHLAANSRYRSQAFRFGASAWGLQFHLEVDEGAVGAFLEAFSPDAVRAGTTPETIRTETRGALAALEPYRAVILARFAGLVASHDRESLVER